MSYTIRKARKLCKDENLQGCVVITIEQDGTVRVTSYGASKRQCNAIGVWASGLWRHSITRVPFSTHFGWGNRGKPQPIPAKEWETMPSERRLAVESFDKPPETVGNSIE